MMAAVLVLIGVLLAFASAGLWLLAERRRASNCGSEPPKQEKPDRFGHPINLSLN